MAPRANDQAGGTGGDRAEFAAGKASSADKREVGFVKKGGRLVPGRKTPSSIRRAFKIRRIKPRRGQR